MSKSFADISEVVFTYVMAWGVYFVFYGGLITFEYAALLLLVVISMATAGD